MKLRNLATLFIIICLLVTATATITRIYIGRPRGLIEKTLKEIEKEAVYPLNEREEEKLKNFALRMMMMKIRGTKDIYANAFFNQNEEKKTPQTPAKPATTKKKNKSGLETYAYNNFCYIKIDNFNSENNYCKQITKFLSQKAGKKIIIIDLRNNPGGDLIETRNILDLFLKANLKIIFPTKIGRNVPLKNARTIKAQLFKNSLIVLVNENTASGGEIFADAIQRYNRGIVVGRPTYGKNCMQTVIEIEKGVEIAFTVAKFHYLSGGNKIIPDIITEKGGNALQIAIRYLLK